jgi:hypothetical protein
MRAVAVLMALIALPAVAQVSDAAALYSAPTSGVSLASVGSTPAAAGASLSAGVLTLQPASASFPGVVTTGTQTLAGAKTFPNTITSTVIAGSAAFQVVTGARICLDNACSVYIFGGSDFQSPNRFTILGVNADDYFSGTTAAVKIKGGIANGASAIGVKIGNLSTLTTAGAKIMAFYNDTNFSNEKLAVGKNGQLVAPTAQADSIVGTATLVGGTVTVSTTAVAAGSKIFFGRNTPGGTVGDLSAPSASIVAATSFVLNSASGTDTSTVNWWIVN